MKKIFASIFCLSLALATSSCSAGSASSSQNADSAQAAIAFADVWGSNTELTASDVVNDLKSVGLCAHIDEQSDGVYASDSLREFKAGAFVQCENYTPTQDYTSIPCASSIYISAGQDATLYDPKRSLEYEDGASLVLFYGDNYQIEISPVDQGSGADYMKSHCASLLDSATAAIGGMRTLIGDYSDSSTNSGEDTQTAASDTSASNLITVPNFVGSTAGEIENWAWQNGFQPHFFYGTKMGYNYSVSCQMQKIETVLAQNPTPGSVVQNSPTVTIWFDTDC